MSKTKKESKTTIDFSKIIETANKGIDLAPVSLKRSSSVQDSVPSGSLVYDLITGGGFAPGRWTTLYGAEGVGKSLMTCQSIKHALDLGIPTFAFDHEGCVTGDTYIQTEDGLQTVDEIIANNNIVFTNADQFVIYNKKILSCDGMQVAQKIYYAGKKKTKKIILHNKYELVGSYEHKVLIEISNDIIIYRKWSRFEDLNIGDNVITEGFNSFPIVSIEDVGLQNVYDFTVEDENILVPHSLITNGIVSHNSYDPSFMSRMGIDFNKLTLDTSNFYYYQPETGEMTYRYIHRILDQLPDKSEGPVSAIFIVDSLPAMLPEARDENDNSSPMGAVARMHSLNMPLIVTKIASKRVCILATNQMRNKIGGYGDPSIESCGEAPKYFSHCRVKMSLRSFKDEGPIHEEPAWDGFGIDRYRLCEIRTVKNKVFSPFRQSTMRLWFEEKGAPGRGIDPVYDCYQYLVETGQAVMHRGRIALTVPGWTNRTYLWKEFKELILVPEDRLALVAERYKVDENSSLRLYCRSQLNDGTAFTKYFDAVGQVNSIGELPDDTEKASK